MKLKDRLAELMGKNVKIGGSNGFIYCGEVFPGLEVLLDEIQEQERWRVGERLVKAQRTWDEREARWQVKVDNAASDLRMFMLTAAELEDELAGYQNIVDRVEKQLKKFTAHQAGDKRAIALRRLRTRYRLRVENTAFNLKDAERGIKRCDSLCATYARPNAKEAQFRSWKNTLNNYTKEYNSLEPMSKMDIKEEYGSWFGGRIIIMPSSISGPYWDIGECKADRDFQIRIAKVRAKYGIKPYVFE